jgi:Spy/CpxP family protein refolding chaperone
MIKLLRTTVAMVLLATAVCAQSTGVNPGPPSGTPPDPQTMIQMRVSFLATLLNLTDAQKSQALTIYTNAYAAAQTLQTTLQTTRQNLTAAIKSNNTASIDQLTGTIGSLDGQRLAISSKADAAFYALLTADQQAKYDSLPHGPGGGPGGPGGPGGFGPAGFRGAAGR